MPPRAGPGTCAKAHSWPRCVSWVAWDQGEGRGGRGRGGAEEGRLDAVPLELGLPLVLGGIKSSCKRAIFAGRRPALPVADALQAITATAIGLAHLQAILLLEMDVPQVGLEDPQLRLLPVQLLRLWLSVGHGNSPLLHWPRRPVLAQEKRLLDVASLLGSP